MSLISLTLTGKGTNGVEVHCWPEFAVDDEIYCTILPNEAEKVSKDYSDENIPMLIKLTPKDR